MTIGSGNRVDLSYVAEVTRGTTPGSPSMKTLRAIGRKMDLMKNILESQEVRQDRQKSDVRHGFNRIDGSIPFELSLSAYDDMLECALAGTWTAVTISGSPNLGAVASSKTFTRAAGSFVTDDVLPGMYITTAGFTNAANNGTHLVTAVASSAVTVTTTLVDEGSTTGRTITIPGKILKCGTTLRTFTFERRFNDLTLYTPFRGVTIGAMDLKIQPEAIVGGSMTMLGMSAGATSGSSLGSPSAAPTNSPFSAFDGSMYEGGSLISLITGLNLKIDNGRSLKPVVGSKFSPDVFDGTANITGDASALFQDASLEAKFVNETESKVWLRLNDLNGTDFMNFVLPRIKYTGHEIDPPQEGPVPESMPFRCLVDSVSATSLWIQRSNT